MLSPPEAETAVAVSRVVSPSGSAAWWPGAVEASVSGPYCTCASGTVGRAVSVTRPVPGATTAV